MLGRIALQTLCSYWGLTSDYRDEVLAVIRGMDWDDADDARLVAISIGGEWLRAHHDPVLAHALLDLGDDKSARRLIREAAVSALARAVGLEYSEIPGPTAECDPDGVWGRGIRQRARVHTARPNG